MKITKEEYIKQHKIHKKRKESEFNAFFIAVYFLKALVS